MPPHACPGTAALGEHCRAPVPASGPSPIPLATGGQPPAGRLRREPRSHLPLEVPAYRARDPAPPPGGGLPHRAHSPASWRRSTALRRSRSPRTRWSQTRCVPHTSLTPGGWDEHARCTPALLPTLSQDKPAPALTIYLPASCFPPGCLLGLRLGSNVASWLVQTCCAPSTVPLPRQTCSSPHNLLRCILFSPLLASRLGSALTPQVHGLPLQPPAVLPTPSGELVPIDPSQLQATHTPVHGAPDLPLRLAARGPRSRRRGCQVLEARLGDGFPAEEETAEASWARSAPASFLSPGISAFTLTSTLGQGREGIGGSQENPRPLPPNSERIPEETGLSLLPCWLPSLAQSCCRAGDPRASPPGGHTTALLAAAIPTQAGHSRSGVRLTCAAGLPAAGGTAGARGRASRGRLRYPRLFDPLGWGSGSRAAAG